MSIPSKESASFSALLLTRRRSSLPAQTGQSNMLIRMHMEVPNNIVDTRFCAIVNSSLTRYPESDTKLKVRMNIMAP